MSDESTASAAPASATLPDRLPLRLLSPEEMLYEGPADWVQLPLVDGRIGIWPGHAPLVGALTVGTIEYSVAGETRSLEVNGGVLHIDEEHCDVLVGVSSIPVAPAERDIDALTDQLEEALLQVFDEEQVRKLQDE